jgi:acyl carrier protein
LNEEVAMRASPERVHLTVPRTESSEESELHTKLVTLIVKTVAELREQLDIQSLSCFDQGTPLFGRDGILDSLGLVTLVVAVEQAIEDTLSVSVSLADEKAMSQRHSPFRTIGSLAEYATRVIGELD